jgi:hypothetical protein
MGGLTNGSGSTERKATSTDNLSQKSNGGDVRRTRVGSDAGLVSLAGDVVVKKAPPPKPPMPNVARVEKEAAAVCTTSTDSSKNDLGDDLHKFVQFSRQ